MTEKPKRKGRMIAMSDEIDALITEIARRESIRRRRHVTRAELIEEWARKRQPADWVYHPDPEQRVAEFATAAD